MKIYISGKIAGTNFSEANKMFHNAAMRLIERGDEIINPFNMEPCDRFDWIDYIMRDILYLKKCDAIYMLKNWEDSPGARVEREIAIGLGLDVRYESYESIEEMNKNYD